MDRNPWHPNAGNDPWKEFLFDVRHPSAFFLDGWDGVKATFVWMFPWMRTKRRG
jgi:hypothetical protein